MRKKLKQKNEFLVLTIVESSDRINFAVGEMLKTAAKKILKKIKKVVDKANAA